MARYVSVRHFFSPLSLSHCRVCVCYSFFAKKGEAAERDIKTSGVARVPSHSIKRAARANNVRVTFTPATVCALGALLRRDAHTRHGAFRDGDRCNPIRPRATSVPRDTAENATPLIEVNERS